MGAGGVLRIRLLVLAIVVTDALFEDPLQTSNRDRSGRCTTIRRFRWSSSRRGLAEMSTAIAALAESLLDAGIELFLGVPGYPVTQLLEELESSGARVVDPQNEKTGAEMAVGSSLSGVPVALVLKGNGALLAAEPLQNAGPHGVGAPLLVVVGDDILAERVDWT